MCIFVVHSLYIVLFCYTVSLSIITLGNNTLHNCFVGVSAIKDGSHLCLRVKCQVHVCAYIVHCFHIFNLIHKGP